MSTSVVAVVPARRSTVPDTIGSKYSETLFDAVFRMQDATSPAEEREAELAFQRACGRHRTPQIPGKRAYPRQSL